MSAPSVPESLRASRASRERIQSPLSPDPPVAKTSWRPSGETATCGAAGPRVIEVPSGGRTAKRMLSRSSGSPRTSAKTANSTDVTARTTVAPRSPGLRRRSSAFVSMSARPSAVRSNCNFTSCAVCQRSVGSFVRQPRTNQSRLAGATGRSSVIGRGSRSKIAAIKLARLLPSNARAPVIIS